MKGTREGARKNQFDGHRSRRSRSPPPKKGAGSIEARERTRPGSSRTRSPRRAKGHDQARSRAKREKRQAGHVVAGDEGTQPGTDGNEGGTIFLARKAGLPRRAAVEASANDQERTLDPVVPRHLPDPGWVRVEIDAGEERQVVKNDGGFAIESPSLQHRAIFVPFENQNPFLVDEFESYGPHRRKAPWSGLDDIVRLPGVVARFERDGEASAPR